MAKSIEVRDLNIYYGSFLAVEGVHMTIRPAQVTALIGPSGCGKSTFLRSINRMHEVIPGAYVQGSLELDGTDLYAPGTDPVTVRRQVGMVFQRPNPFPTMSIYDNVIAGQKLNSRKASKSVTDELVERSLRGANLWNEVKDRLDKPGAGLSGGQQQRLCIARAIAVQPDVLLMDEPCSALDPISTLAIEDLINELKQDYTIVIVTHNMQQAARVSDYTGFFNIEGTGKPGKLVEMHETKTIFPSPRKKPPETYVRGRFGGAPARPPHQRHVRTVHPYGRAVRHAGSCGTAIRSAGRAVGHSTRARPTPAAAPTSWAATNAGTETGAMPAKVSLNIRPAVTAGFAKDVDEVNQ